MISVLQQHFDYCILKTMIRSLLSYL